MSRPANALAYGASTLGAAVDFTTPGAVTNLDGAKFYQF